MTGMLSQVNRTIKTIICSLCIGLAFACSEKAVDPVPQPDPQEEQKDTTQHRQDPTIAEDSHVRLVEVLQRRSWQLDEYKAFLDTVVADFGEFDMSTAHTMVTAFTAACYNGLNNSFLFEKNRKWHFEQYIYSYRSVSASGDSITLQSGVVLPCPEEGHSHKLDGITLYNHYLTTANFNLPPELGCIASTRVLFNEAVVFSDTEGFGISSDRFPPFFDSFAKGRQQIDAAMAALELMEDAGVTLDKNAYTENVGASLGASQAIGAQMYLESDLCPQWCTEKLPGLRTYATTGPLEPKEIFMTYAETDSISYAIIPLMMVYTLFSSYPELAQGYEVKDFFIPEMATEKMVTAYGQEYTFFEAIECKNVGSEKIHSAFEEYFDNRMLSFISKDMLDAEGKFDPAAEKSRILLEAMDRLKLTDWSPKHPLLIVHSKDDDVIPYGKTYISYMKLAAHSSNVEFAHSYGNHQTATTLGITRIALMNRPSYNIEWNSTFK